MCCGVGILLSFMVRPFITARCLRCRIVATGQHKVYHGFVCHDVARPLEQSLFAIGDPVKFAIIYSFGNIVVRRRLYVPLR